MELRLEDAQLELLADLVAERLAKAVRPGLVDADAIAALLSVERDWVYEHAADLGVVKLGAGPKARLRFDADVVLERLNSCSAGRRSSAPDARDSRPSKRRQATRKGTDPPLLPIREPLR